MFDEKVMFGLWVPSFYGCFIFGASMGCPLTCEDQQNPNRGTREDVGVHTELESSRSTSKANLRSNSTAESKPSSKSGVQVNKQVRGSIPWQRPEVDRLVAIGGVHGDLERLLQALRVAGAISQTSVSPSRANKEKDNGPQQIQGQSSAQLQSNASSWHWSGGRLVVVQMGDILDDGDQEREVLDLLNRLGKEAKEQGGEVRIVPGDHEFNNVAGHFQEVSPQGMRAFDGIKRHFEQHDHGEGDSKSTLPTVPTAPTVHWHSFAEKMWAKATPGNRSRLAALLPGGPYALQLANHLVVVVYGKTLFVHGGLRPQHLEYGIARINAEARGWLMDGWPEEPGWIHDARGPTMSTPSCEEISEVLRELQLHRMVVSYSEKGQEGESSSCEGKLWHLHDLRKAKEKGEVSSPTKNDLDRTSILEIQENRVKVLPLL